MSFDSQFADNVNPENARVLQILLDFLEKIVVEDNEINEGAREDIAEAGDDVEIFDSEIDPPVIERETGSVTIVSRFCAEFSLNKDDDTKMFGALLQNASHLYVHVLENDMIEIKITIPNVLKV